MANCGVKAHVKFKVDAELVGQLGKVTIDRLGKHKTTTAGAFKIDRTQVEFEWPDQTKPGSSSEHFGGRKVDWSGLDKQDYKAKFAAQEFEVQLTVAAKGAKSSKQVKIEPHPDGGPVHRQVGFAMNINQSTNTLTTNALGQVVPMFPQSPAQQASWVPLNIGNFWIEHKEGLVIVRVKVEFFTNQAGKTIDDRVFNHFKKSVEKFWNGASGFRQWVFHSKKCVRKLHCDCPVLFKGESSPKEKLLLGGCCKFPIRVNVEKGSDNRVEIEFLSPTQVQSVRMHNIQHGTKVQATLAPGQYFSTAYVCYPEDAANSYAHEVGHMMGLPDEYEFGSICPPAVPGQTSLFPISADSIMGANMTVALKRHFEWGELARDWVSGNVTPVVAIERAK